MTLAKNRKVVCKTTQIDLGNHEFVEVMPIADLHIGDGSFNERLLDGVCAWVNEKEYRYVVIAGDIFNAGIKDSVSSVYHETMTLQDALSEFKRVVEKLGADNIIGVVRGNHDNRVVKTVGLDPVAVACELSGIDYCGAEGYLSLAVGDWKTRTEKRTPIKYLMFLTHGAGGGRQMGSKVNGVMRHASIVVADIYVQGHTHTPTIVPSVIYVSDSKCASIVEKDQLFIITASFTGRDGYAKDFCFSPLSNKLPIIRLSGKDKILEAELREI